MKKRKKLAIVRSWEKSGREPGSLPGIGFKVETVHNAESLFAPGGAFHGKDLVQDEGLGVFRQGEAL